MLHPPLDPKLVFVNKHFLKRNIDVEQKTKLTIRKKTKIKKGDLKEKRRKETPQRERIDEKNPRN